MYSIEDATTLRVFVSSVPSATCFSPNLADSSNKTSGESNDAGISSNISLGLINPGLIVLKHDVQLFGQYLCISWVRIRIFNKKEETESARSLEKVKERYARLINSESQFFLLITYTRPMMMRKQQCSE
jgi:hypothetical protein